MLSDRFFKADQPETLTLFCPKCLKLRDMRAGTKSVYCHQCQQTYNKDELVEYNNEPFGSRPEGPQPIRIVISG